MGIDLYNQGHKKVFPFCKLSSQGPVLGITPSCYVKRGKARLMKSASENMNEIVRISSNFIKELNDFSETGLFDIADVEHLSGCLVLSYLTEIVGDIKEFNNLAMEHSELLQQFFDWVGIKTRIKVAVYAVKPADDWDKSKSIGHTYFIFNVIDKALSLGQLKLCDNSLWFDMHIGEGYSTRYIYFPDYDLWKNPSLSKEDYLKYMWSHLYMQLLNAFDIFVKKGQFVLKELSDLVGGKVFFSDNSLIEVNKPEDIMRALYKFQL